MLNKAIIHGKEFRKPYYGSQRFDRSCRCHGGCGYCEQNRRFSYNRDNIKTINIVKEQIEELDTDISSVTISF